MNIALISVYFLPTTVGGVELHMYHLCRALQRMGHTVTVFQPVLVNGAGKAVVVEQSVDGISVCRVEVPSRIQPLHRKLDGVRTDTKLGYLVGFAKKLSYTLYARSIFRAIKRYLPDVDLIHQHDFSSSWWLTRRLRREKPCLLTNHTGEFLFIRRNRWLRRLIKPALSHYGAVIGPSHELCDLGYPDSRVTYIPNGVQLDKFMPVGVADKNALRENLGLATDDFVVLCPRRWAPTKGVRHLVEALPRLRERSTSRVRVLMVGSDYNEYPAYRESILKRVDELGLRQDVMLCGNASADQMAQYYGASDVVVLPSLMEATSLAGLEAMGCGLPLVATDVGGLPEIITNGVNGILVPPAEPLALADALADLAADGELRKQMGEAGHQRAVEEFSWDAIACRTVAVYQRVLSAGK